MDKLVASTFGGMAMDAMLAGKSGLMAAMVHGCYAMVADPRSEAWARAKWTSRPCTTPTATAPTTTTRSACRSSSQGVSSQIDLRPARSLRAEIRAFSIEAAADEEHYPSTIDPDFSRQGAAGASRRSARQARGRYRLRQRPLRPHRAGTRPGAASAHWIWPKRCSLTFRLNSPQRRYHDRTPLATGILRRRLRHRIAGARRRHSDRRGRNVPHRQARRDNRHHR